MWPHQITPDCGLPMASGACAVSRSESSESWFALHVRVRSETFVSSVLQRKGFETFAPTCPARRKYTDRIKKVENALFPGYVFCRFDPAEALPIVTTPSVHSILCNGSRPAPVSEAEVESVRRAADFGLASPAPFLATGHRVRVDHGPLTGVEGLVVSLKNAQRLIINVELLQRSVVVQVDPDDVSPV